MKILFSQNSWVDYNSWRTEDKMVLQKINCLIKEIQLRPNQRSGKPESLRSDLEGLWSRRINREHRLVYQVVGDELLIYSCRYHYAK